MPGPLLCTLHTANALKKQPIKVDTIIILSYHLTRNAAKVKYCLQNQRQIIFDNTLVTLFWLLLYYFKLHY